MTLNSQEQPRLARYRWIAFAALCIFTASLSGCPKGPATQKLTHVGILRPPNPPVIAGESTLPEIPIAEPTNPLASPEEAAAAPLPVVFDVPPEKPPAPHHTAPAPEAEPEKPPATPQITPQISPQEQVRAQSDTTADLETARQNLNSVSGRRMNATQQDLADKIRGFIVQARDAMKAGDWKSARNLAEKARVLSIELVHSF